MRDDYDDFDMEMANTVDENPPEEISPEEFIPLSGQAIRVIETEVAGSPYREPTGMPPFQYYPIGEAVEPDPLMPSASPGAISSYKTGNCLFEWRGGKLYGCRKKNKDNFILIGKDFITTLLMQSGKVIGVMFQDQWNPQNRVILRLSDIHVNVKKCIKRLVDAGIDITGSRPAQMMLREYLTDVVPKFREQGLPATATLGWSQDGLVWSFINPAIAESEGDRVPILISDDPQSRTRPWYPMMGNLRDWQEHIGRHCAGNWNLVFAICAAVSGVFLQHTQHKGFCLNFFGESSCGKTTMLRVGGTVLPRLTEEPFNSWRTTDNGLEEQCYLHNDYTMFMDELGECDPSLLLKIIYMVANGQGKRRATQDMPRAWNCIVLSSSEVPAKTHIESAGARYPAGLIVRCVDIPAEVEGGYGVFHYVPPEFPDAAAFSQYLSESSERYRDTVIPSLLQEFLKDRYAGISQLTRNMREFSNMVPHQPDSQIQRVLNNFALIAAAGEFAISKGVLPWPAGHAYEAAFQVFHQWLAHHHESSKTLRERVLERLFSTLQRYGESRFLPYLGRKSLGDLKDAYGYRQELQGGFTELVIPDEGFERMFTGFLIRNCCMVLDQENILLREGRNLKAKRAIPGNPSARCYVLRVNTGQWE